MLDHTTVMWQTDVTVKRKNMKNKNNIILIIIFVILVGVLIYIVSTDKKENSVVNESTKSYKYEVVNDYSDFFTIENCVNKYFNYLSLKDKDSLMKILDQEYLTSTNNVLENNNNKYIGKNISIRLNGMYKYDNIYYVKGTIYEELKNKVNKLEDEYLIVKVDKDFKLFSITPIDKVKYNEGINEK